MGDGRGTEVRPHCFRQVSGELVRALQSSCPALRRCVLSHLLLWGCTATLLKWQGAQAAPCILGHDFPLPKFKGTPWFFCPASVCYSRLSSFQVDSLLGALWFSCSSPGNLFVSDHPPTKFRHAGTLLNPIAGMFQFTFPGHGSAPV